MIYRQSQEDITRNGIRAARTVLYAKALLLFDQGEFARDKWTIDHVVVAVGLTDRALVRLKERFVQYGWDTAWERKKPVRPSRELFFDGKFAAWQRYFLLSVLKRQCLPERIPDIELMRKVITIWNRERNTKQTPEVWQFATTEVRGKLKQLYPIL